MVPLSLINIIIAFGAGFLTFFAGCLAPVAPVYIAFLAGSSSTTNSTKKKALLLRNSVAFTSGFILVFMLLGLGFYSFAQSVAVIRPLIERIGGIILILFGLHFVNAISLPFLNKTGQATAKGKAGTLGGSFLIGTTFGVTWTPCVGPVLAGIFLLAGTQSTFIQAFLLLLFFSLGLATPFLLLGIAFEKYLPFIKGFNKHAPLIHTLAGILLIVFGILLFLQQFSIVSGFLLSIFGNIAMPLEFNYESQVTN